MSQRPLTRFPLLIPLQYRLPLEFFRALFSRASLLPAPIDISSLTGLFIMLSWQDETCREVLPDFWSPPVSEGSRRTRPIKVLCFSHTAIFPVGRAPLVEGAYYRSGAEHNVPAASWVPQGIRKECVPTCHENTHKSHPYREEGRIVVSERYRMSSRGSVDMLKDRIG